MSPATAVKSCKSCITIRYCIISWRRNLQLGKLGYEDQQRFNALSPEEQAAERADQEAFAFDIDRSIMSRNKKPNKRKSLAQK